MRRLAFVMLMLLALVLVNAVYTLPFGSTQLRTASDYYEKNALEKTGSPNIVNSIVWDFRGYDTLGEEAVLFAAALGVLLITGGMHGRDN
jgi:multisubunit Na+/H+ antiporter MnhB subunit